MSTLLKLSILSVSCSQVRSATTDDGVKTTFQTFKAWRPSLDNRADAVMIYGTWHHNDSFGENPPFEERVRSWKEKGYKVHYMSGIAWGEYDDYFYGKWDGKEHLDEAQTKADGQIFWHDGVRSPYIVPTVGYLDYYKETVIKKVIDAGIDAIFMEEPEFWTMTGYSEAFKREWEDFYGFPWRPQHESAENTYLSNKLKYHLYYRALNEVFTFAKSYGASKGIDVKCYVPTHSLLSYTQIGIVSPEASLASLPCVDGYIAQVWTGTARQKVHFDGLLRERAFENAYLEYGTMQSMTAPTGRKVFFLTDPVEDLARDWEDYKLNYQATFTAQLLYPGVASYEVMPWPERIYEGYYPESATSDKRIRIPADYATMMQVMINTLNRMPLSTTRIEGSQGINVLMGNSLMFQRFPGHPGYSDPDIADFYGQTLPLLKLGIPIGITHLENLSVKNALADVKILIASYSDMKPLDASAHKAIASWVRKGGALIYCGSDDDPFQEIMEWWNTGKNSFRVPSDHLFSLMNIPCGAPEGQWKYGKGLVRIIRQDPKNFVLEKGGDTPIIDAVSDLYKIVCGEDIQFKNHLILKRGMFDIVTVMDESVSNSAYKAEGVFVDLYSPELPVLSEITVPPGRQGLYVDMSRINRSHPCIIASASREYDETVTEGKYSFISKGPLGTASVMRVFIPSAPKKVLLNGQPYSDESLWDTASSTCLLRFPNSPDGINVEIFF